MNDQIYYVTPTSKKTGRSFFALSVSRLGIFQLNETITWYDHDRPGLPIVVQQGTKFTCRQLRDDGTGYAFAQGTACNAEFIADLDEGAKTAL